MMITLRTFLLTIALSFAFQVFPQSMKMVVDSAGNVVGRYVRTNADTYTVGVQDIFDVAKTGKRIVTFHAKKRTGHNLVQTHWTHTRLQHSIDKK